MLAPQDREPLLDALRPEPGTVLDAAVGTTFTLDLEALLLAPRRLRCSNWTALDRIRRHCWRNPATRGEDRAVMRRGAHADAGHRAEAVRTPRADGAPRQRAPLRSFHPKIWVLRFRSSGGGMRHRVLVMSRNLTFDTSWDLIARFDEDPDGALIGAEVAACVQALVSIAPSRVASSVARSVATARFEIPEPFTFARLHLQGSTSTP